MSQKGKDFDPERGGNPFRALTDKEIHRLQQGISDPTATANGDPLHALSIFNATDLSAMNLPEPRFVVDGVLPEGASLLVAKPKVGKSMLMQQIAASLAMGGKALGKVDVEQGRVLYLMLEGSKRGLKRRLQAMIPDAAWPSNLHFAQRWPAVDDGGIEMLEHFITRYPDTRLIVVDTLQHVRGRVDARRSLYETDYEALHPFSALYEKTGVSVVIIHHANKREGSADVVDQVSGSTGLSGAVENVLAMVRDRQHTILKVRPREEEESELALAFDPALMTWVLCGQAAQVTKTDERQEIIDVLKLAAEPVRTKEIAALVDKPANSVAQLLYKMKHQGVVRQPKYGYYELVERGESLSDYLPGAKGPPDDEAT